MVLLSDSDVVRQGSVTSPMTERRGLAGPPSNGDSFLTLRKKGSQPTVFGWYTGVCGGGEREREQGHPVMYVT